MATITQVVLEDDVDGGDADESIEFSLDGVTYEIDLSEKNADALREAFAQWTDAGRRTGGRQKQGTGPRTLTRTSLPAQKAPITVAERHAIQRWASVNGFAVPAERGRIAAAVVAEWEAAGRPM